MFGITVDEITLWGAVLGLLAFAWNVLAFIGSAWPRLMPQPHKGAFKMKVAIVNHSNRPLMVTRISQRFARAGGVKLMPDTDEKGLTVHEAANLIGAVGGEFPYFVGPNQTATIKVSPNTSETGSALLVVWWHRFWLFPGLRLPSFIWVSGLMADKIQDGAVGWRE